MKLKFFARLFALAAVCLLPGITASVHAAGTVNASDAVTEVNIARIKNVLKLTPEQHAYWVPVEAALRSVAREQSDPNAGLVRRVSRRVVSIVLNSATAARVGAAAQPLIGTLDPQQRDAALALVREMGLGPVLAALN